MSDPLPRRLFIQISSSLGAAGLITSQGAADRAVAAQPGASSDLGRHIYKSLKWNMVKLAGSTQQKFEILKELGYDGVELDSPNGIDAKEAVAASESTGLPIEGVVNSTHWRVRHSDPDPSVRAQASADMREAMNFAHRVGAGSVLLVPGKVTDPDNENHDQVWERSISAIKQLAPLANRLGIQILIENVGNGFCETPELFAQYIDAIDHPDVGIHFDIGNHIRISPPAKWIGVLGKRIKKLDVKDRTTSNERTLIGDGDADWPQVRNALQELGYQGWAAAEVPGGDRARLADVLDRMNRVLGKSDGQPQSLASVPPAGVGKSSETD